MAITLSFLPSLIITSYSQTRTV